MRSTVSHASRTTREAETAYFATEGYPLLMVTRFTPNPQKSVFKTTTLQLVLERPSNLVWELPALLRQYALELRPMLLDPLIKQRVLWRVSLILKRADLFPKVSSMPTLDFVKAPIIWLSKHPLI